jgi:hypothetical protein
MNTSIWDVSLLCLIAAHVDVDVGLMSSGQPCSGVSSKDCDFIDVSLVSWLHQNEMGWDATLCLVLEPGGWLDLTISPVHLGRMQWTQQHASVGDRLFRLDRASKRVLDVKNTNIYWIKSRKT